MLQRVLWLNTHASFIGGCESYIYNTVLQLKQRGIKSSLLYDPNKPVSRDFLCVFDEAFPCTSLVQQVEEATPDIIYVHQYWDIKELQELVHSPYPLVRFYHDHHLFCLRTHKVRTAKKEPCYDSTSWKCYSCLGFLNRSEDRKSIKIRTLKSLRNQQSIDHQFDAWVVGSNYMQQQLLGDHYDPCKTHVIPLYAAQPPHHVEQKREKALLLFAGQLLPGKGLDLLLQALSSIQEPYQLIVAGTGREEGHYKNLTNSLGLNSRITFIGQVSQARLQELYQQASCLVFPTRAPETFGLVGPEAMRWGLPVIASDIGGIGEWLAHEQTGLKVPPGDVLALKTAILRVLRNPEWASSMGKKALKVYEESFLPEKHVSDLLTLFSSLANKKKDHRPKEKRIFTAQGSKEVEEKVQLLVNAVAEKVEACISSEDYVALILIGGYGKGEGGVEKREGSEWPHNNLDFVLVIKNRVKPQNLQKSLDETVAPLRESWCIGIDFCIIKEAQLRRASPLLIWYEMAAGGSKTILGNPHFVRSLNLASIHKVPEQDFIRLMVNRGTLLLINLWMSENLEGSLENYRRVFLRHIMKSIIGFGDALLFFHGDYHWSYLKKCRRIQQRWDLPESFRSLYLEASDFRLNPDYDKYTDKYLIEWSTQLLQSFAPLYLRCESIRLKLSKLCWDDYFQGLFFQELSTGWLSPRSALRKCYGLLNQPSFPIGNSAQERWGFRCLDPTSRLYALFPIVAFGIGSKNLIEQTRIFLQADSTSSKDLRRAFLSHWMDCGDHNFTQFLKQHGLTLEASAL